MTWATADAGSAALAWARTSRDLVVTVTSTVWARGTRGLRSSENSTSIARIRSSKRWTLASLCSACARSRSGTSTFLPFTVNCMGRSPSDRRLWPETLDHAPPAAPPSAAGPTWAVTRIPDRSPCAASPDGPARTHRDSTHSKHGSTRQYDRANPSRSPLTSEASMNGRLVRWPHFLSHGRRVVLAWPARPPRRTGRRAGRRRRWRPRGRPPRPLGRRHGAAPRRRLPGSDPWWPRRRPATLDHREADAEPWVAGGAQPGPPDRGRLG